MSSSNTQYPKIGVGAIIRRDGKIVVGLRTGSHGAGSWSVPGGHLEFGETPEQTAVREVFEETGLRVKNPKFVAFTNDVYEAEQLHYITIFISVEYVDGETEVREPDRCERWEWRAREDLPRPLFLPLQHLLEQGYNPFA